MSCPFFALRARAADTVVLFESAGLRPELCAALRIQLTDVASVDCRPGSEGALPERLAEASRSVADEDARLGVLLERDPDVRLVRMLLVGARPDQAVLAIERIEDRPDPDIDRSLSLKVRDAVEVMHATEQSGRADFAATLADPDRAVRRALLLEIGGGAMFGKQLRALGVAALGVRWMREERFLEGVVAAQLASRIEEDVAEGRIELGEWGISLGARAARMFGRASVGAAVEAGVTRIDAYGATLLDNDGDAELVRPRFAAGLDLRLALTRGFALRFAPGVEFLPIAQEFALNRTSYVELGYFRALLPLSLIVDVPLRGRGPRDAN